MQQRCLDGSLSFCPGRVQVLIRLIQNPSRFATKLCHYRGLLGLKVNVLQSLNQAGALTIKHALHSAL